MGEVLWLGLGPTKNLVIQQWASAPFWVSGAWALGGSGGLDFHVVGFSQTLNASVILFLNLSGAFGRDPNSRRCKGFYALGTKSAASNFGS